MKLKLMDFILITSTNSNKLKNHKTESSKQQKNVQEKQEKTELKHEIITKNCGFKENWAECSTLIGVFEGWKITGEEREREKMRGSRATKGKYETMFVKLYFDYLEKWDAIRNLIHKYYFYPVIGWVNFYWLRFKEILQNFNFFFCNFQW